MAENENEIIFPINAQIFNKASKTISLPITDGFGFRQVLSIVQTYPVIIPRLGRYARLDIKSENVSQLYSELLKTDSSVIISSIHNYDDYKRFVSWGGLSSQKLPDKIYSAYLEALDIFLSSNRPVLLKKPNSLNGFVIKSNRFFHEVKNNLFGNVESATVSLSSVLIKFSKKSLYCKEFFISKDTPILKSVFADLCYFHGSEIQFQEIRLAMTPEMLDFIRENGLGVYACYLYTVNDWIINAKQKPELNLVVHLKEIFYSPDSLFPFYDSFHHETSYSYKIKVTETTFARALDKLKSDTEYSQKDIHHHSPLYRNRQSGGTFTFRILKPYVVFSLINAYCVDLQSREFVDELFSSGDSINYLEDVLSRSPRFLSSGNLIGIHARKFLNEIRKYNIEMDI